MPSNHAHADVIRTAKRSVLSLTIVLCLLTPLTVEGGSRMGWVDKILGKYTDDVVSAARAAEDVGHTAHRSPLTNQELRKMVPALDPGVLQPHTRLLIDRAARFAERGGFEARLLDAAAEPVEVLRQSTRYGDDYVGALRTVAQTFEQNAAAIERLAVHGAASRSSQVLPREAFSEGRIAAGLVEAVRRTGKRGADVVTTMGVALGRWAAGHPAWLSVAGGLLWFETDPESFLAAVQASGKDVVAFVLETQAAATSGAVQGAAQSVQRYGAWVPAGCSLALLLASAAWAPTRRLWIVVFRRVAARIEDGSAGIDRPGPDKAASAPAPDTRSGPLF